MKFIKQSTSIFDLSSYIDLTMPYNYIDDNTLMGFNGYIIRMVTEFTCDEMLTRYYVYKKAR